jgi:hypothetical protein
MLRSILYDILNQNESYFFLFQSQYREYRKRQEQGQDQVQLGAWHYEALKDVLLAIGDHPWPQRLYLIIDAVDESTAEDRSDIIRLLFLLCAKNSCTVKVFVASRPVMELEHYMSKTRASGIIRMQDMNKSDIRDFVDSFLPRIDFPENIVHKAKEYIVDHAQGVFLWVRLVRDRLNKYSMKGTTKTRIFDFLKGLPSELEGFYELILKDLCHTDDDHDENDSDEEDDASDGFKMFQFVLFARRPLTIPELQHCLAIPDDSEVEFEPSAETFEGHIILGIKKRIIHCGRNLLECKDSQYSPGMIHRCR